MTRLNLVLLLAVLATALYLVRTQYESRRLFVELDRANAEAAKLELDNERLQVEKRAQATPLRVEKIAKQQLLMRPATPAITQYVTAPDAAASAPVSAASSAVRAATSVGPAAATGRPEQGTTPTGGGAARAAASVGAAAATGRPEQGMAPSGGSAARAAASVGAAAATGRPEQGMAPSGGSAARAAASVGATSP